MSTILVEQNSLLTEKYSGNQSHIGEVILENLLAAQEPSTIREEIGQRIEYLSFDNLEEQYLANRDLEAERRKCGILKFIRNGVEITDLTTYNAAPPIRETGNDPNTKKPYFILSVRTEKRDDEKESETILFRADSAFATEWEQIDDEVLPIIKGQDPKTTMIGEDLLVSVVEVEAVLDNSEKGSHLEWWQKFFKGRNIRHMTPIGRGPRGMKNITPVQLLTRKILAFTRPQFPGNEELGGLGQIGEITKDSIYDLMDPDILQNAELINTRFIPGKEWGGIGQAIALKYGLIGVIGHIAKMPKNYCTISGLYDPKNRILINIKVESMADEFVGVIPKTPEHSNISYGTGITEPDESSKVMLFQGVGDAATGYKVIDDPFVGLRQ